MSDPRFRHPGLPGTCNGGLGFKPGHWRPDAPTGTVAIPEGPQAPLERPDPDSDGRMGGSVRHAQTAANLAAVEAALMPRRWSPKNSNTD